MIVLDIVVLLRRMMSSWLCLSRVGASDRVGVRDLRRRLGTMVRCRLSGLRASATPCLLTLFRRHVCLWRRVLLVLHRVRRLRCLDLRCGRVSLA